MTLWRGLLFGFADVLNGESSGTRCLLAVTQFKKSCSEEVTYLQCLIQRGMEYPSNGDPAQGGVGWVGETSVAICSLGDNLCSDG